MARIYIVSGSTGEYSDRSDWMVAAYENKAEAEKHVLLAEEWLRVNKLGYGSQYNRCSYTRKENPYDPFFHCSYTGTGYGLDEVELRTLAPEVAQNV